jgi:starch synthase
LADSRHLLWQEDLQAGRFNFLKTGLQYAHHLTTVSRTYAREIQTPELGMGLDGVLRARTDSLVGIVNGIDAEEWDPASDPHLDATYSVDDLAGKAVCKRALLEDFHLAYDPRVPVLGIVSRLTGQKGFELLPDILPILVRERDLRLVVLGSGEQRHESYFQWLRDAFPAKVAVFKGYAERHSHRVEAGSDFFLMPSRYEPCGLNQMYSQRYGTVPIVRRTGGLADTVEDFDPVTGDGTGFVFEAFEPEALLHSIRRALRVWDQPHVFERVREAGMRRDFSWERRVGEYVTLYRRLVAGKPVRPMAPGG